MAASVPNLYWVVGFNNRHPVYKSAKDTDTIPLLLFFVQGPGGQEGWYLSDKFFSTNHAASRRCIIMKRPLS